MPMGRGEQGPGVTMGSSSHGHRLPEGQSRLQAPQPEAEGWEAASLPPRPPASSAPLWHPSLPGPRSEGRPWTRPVGTRHEDPEQDGHTGRGTAPLGFQCGFKKVLAGAGGRRRVTAKGNLKHSFTKKCTRDLGVGPGTERGHQRDRQRSRAHGEQAASSLGESSTLRGLAAVTDAGRPGAGHGPAGLAMLLRSDD